MPDPFAFVETATFSDGTTVTFARNDIVVIVGANNSGKSEALRNIRDKFSAKSIPGVVATSTAIKQEGSQDDVLEWLRKVSRESNTDGLQRFSRGGITINAPRHELGMRRPSVPCEGVHAVK